MKALAGSIRKLAKVGLLASAFVAAALGLAQDRPPANASNTEMFVSYENSESIAFAEPTIILYPGGPPRDVYVWVDKVVETSGASAFLVVLTFDGSLFSVTSFVGDPVWLGESGRGVSCVPPAIINPNDARLECLTPGFVPPYGVQGKGLLATITLQAGSETGAGALSLEGSYLIDTPLHPDDYELIPMTLNSPLVVMLRCADNSGDGTVDLANDILGVILRYQMTSSDLDWDPAYDLDDSGNIDLANDILGTIIQYQQDCDQ